MTATTPIAPWSRGTTALILLLGGALLFAGFLVTPWDTWPTTADYHASLREHAGQARVAAVLCFGGLLTLAPGAFGLLSVLERRGRPRTVAAAAAIAGACAMPGVLFQDFYDVAMAQRLDPAQSAVIADAAHQGLATVILLGVPVAVLGILGLLLALRRDGHASLLAPAAWLAGWAMEFATLQTNVATGALSGLLIAVGLGLAARGVWQDREPAPRRSSRSASGTPTASGPPWPQGERASAG